MEEAQTLSSQEKENLAGEVMDSMGVEGESSKDELLPEKDDKDDLPLVAKQRLGKQEKRHRKEMRAMQEQLAHLQARLGSSQAPTEDYSPPIHPESGNIQDVVQQAVAAALRAKEDQERQAKEAEKLAHVHKEYQTFRDHLDNADDEHDDFEDVVRAPDAPFTDSIRDAAMLLHKSGVVKGKDLLYKLGKNREQLKKISELPPIDQAAEVMRLGYAMANGSDKSISAPKTIGQIKTNPVISRNSVSEKTPISELRARMKAGWK